MSASDDDDLYKVIGRILRNRRKNLSLTREDALIRMNMVGYFVSMSTLSAWEYATRTMPIQGLVAYAKVLRLPAGAVLSAALGEPSIAAEFLEDNRQSVYEAREAMDALPDN
jgi:transcriptional regulator with XRE-family HTH domain